MSWKEFISRNFGAVIATAVIGVLAAYELAAAILFTHFLWLNPSENIEDLIDILILPAISAINLNWILPFFVSVSLLALTSVIVAIKALPDAIIDTITTRGAAPRATSWDDFVARVTTVVEDLWEGKADNLGKLPIFAWGVMLFILGIMTLLGPKIREFTGMAFVAFSVVGYVLIIAGYVLTIVGIYAAAIRSITNSMAVHMSESGAVSHIASSGSMRLAFILVLSMAAVWIAGGAFVGAGMSILFSATQDIELLILAGAPMVILGNAGMVIFIRRFSSSIADHVSDNSIGTTLNSGDGDFHLFFQFLAVQILAVAPLLFGIATSDTNVAYLLWSDAIIDIDNTGAPYYEWLWLWSWPAILIFVLGSLAVATRHVSNRVEAIVRRRAEIAARRQ